MDKKNFLYYYIKIAPIIFSISISVFLSLILICSSFYIHEGGHWVFGKFDNILNGRNSEFEITNWDSCYFGFFKIPQQIKIVQGEPSLNFKFGGILMVILVSTAISLIFYILTRRKIYLLIPFVFLIHEGIGNFLCGTDNLTNNPYPICENVIVRQWPIFLWFVFVIILSIILYPRISKLIKDFLRYRRNK